MNILLIINVFIFLLKVLSIFLCIIVFLLIVLLSVLLADLGRHLFLFIIVLWNLMLQCCYIRPIILLLRLIHLRIVPLQFQVNLMYVDVYFLIGLFLHLLYLLLVLMTRTLVHLILSLSIVLLLPQICSLYCCLWLPFNTVKFFFGVFVLIGLIQLSLFPIFQAKPGTQGDNNE